MKTTTKKPSTRNNTISNLMGTVVVVASWFNVFALWTLPLAAAVVVITGLDLACAGPIALAIVAGLAYVRNRAPRRS